MLENSAIKNNWGILDLGMAMDCGDGVEVAAIRA